MESPSFRADQEAGGTSSPEFGFCHAGYSVSAQEYALLESLGADWIRIDISWKRVEPEEGRWTFDYYDKIIEGAEANGVNVLAVLGFDTPWIRERTGDDERRIHPDSLPEFLQYVKVVGERYGAMVDGFEVWNEPNLPRFWGGTDEEFFLLTKEATQVLGEAAPDVPVGVGSIHISPFFHGRRFLRDFLEAGCADEADALTIHPYTRNTAKAASWLEFVEESAEARGLSLELWVTEVGFPTASLFPYRVSLEDQPEYVRRSLTSLVYAGADLITWYKLFSNKGKEMSAGAFDGASFGLVWNEDHTSYEWKPGAYAFRDTVDDLTKAVWKNDAP